MTDWHIEARGGHVIITPPSTVADVVTTARRVDGVIVEGERVAVPAGAPGFVMTAKDAAALWLQIRRVAAHANAQLWRDTRAAKVERDGGRHE